MDPYDAFLSYNTAEFARAEALARELTRLGLRIWLDRWELRPGRTWLDELEEALAASNAVAILIGPAGTGPWQRAEVRAALSDFVGTGHPVVPVLLPGVTEIPQLPAFLSHHTWVDCRPQETSAQQLAQLAWGLTARRPRTVVSQFVEPFNLPVTEPQWRRRSLRVYPLPNTASDRLLDITWDSFGAGVEILATQIRNYGSRIAVDGCVGINEAGLAMATFLGSGVFDRSLLGYVRCGKRADRVVALPGTYFPELSADPVLLVCDFEVKYAAVLPDIITILREEYGNPTIYFAVFGALTESDDLAINSLDDLPAASFLRESGIRDLFIAATMGPPGIEPPMGLR
jgi:hypothetical protein